MSEIFEVIIVGLGAMGSSALYHLAKNNVKVLGIDQFKPPHTEGSSHGNSRIIREAYFEDPLYVPIVQRAYELLSELEKEANTNLLLPTGGLMIGNPDFTLVKGAKSSADLHNLDYELLNYSEIKAKFPAFNVREDEVAVLEERAGILFPELCIQSHLELAKKYSAEIKVEESVTNFDFKENEVTLTTNKGNIYKAKKVILSCGAWISKILPDLELKLKIERQVLFWFEVENVESFEPENFPIYIWEYDYDSMIYGFPVIDEKGLKIAFYHGGEHPEDPSTLNKELKPEELEKMKVAVAKHFPTAKGKFKEHAVCMYTNTEDLNFLIDFHPKYSNVLIASPCSGHGFKFASAIGEILKDLTLTGTSKFDLKPFKIRS